MPKRPRICINWNPPFQTQIYLVKVPLNVNIVKQDLINKKTVFENFMKWGLKGGISIDADSEPPRYILWCCGSQEAFTFILIGYCHTVFRGLFFVCFHEQKFIFSFCVHTKKLLNIKVRKSQTKFVKKTRLFWPPRATYFGYFGYLGYHSNGVSVPDSFLYSPW